MKKVLTLIILIFTSITMSYPVYGENTESEVIYKIVSPNFSNISFVIANINIGDDGLAHVQTTVSARNIDKIVINMFLQKYENGNWITLKSWYQVKFGSESVLYNTMIVSRGFRYRVLSDVSVYDDDRVVETIQASKEHEVF